jgi:hypothetical protein
MTPDLLTLYREELHDANDPRVVALAMAQALAAFLDDLLTQEDPGDRDVKDVPVLVRAKREALALSRTLNRWGK